MRRTVYSILLALAACLSLGGCKAVDFTERRHLGSPLMEFDDGAGETHLQQKTAYSREGSVGGIGNRAGGGCGCY